MRRMSVKSIGAYILTKVPTLAPENESKDELVDYFITKGGQTFAGLHLLIEIWGGRNLTDPQQIDNILREAAEAANATILHSHIHEFLPSGGVSGVVLLAESHISIHTWPERDYAAIDIFMCGECDPHLSVAVLKAQFKPASIQVQDIRRGIVASAV